MQLQIYLKLYHQQFCTAIITLSSTMHTTTMVEMFMFLSSFKPIRLNNIFLKFTIITSTE